MSVLCCIRTLSRNILYGCCTERTLNVKTRDVFVASSRKKETEIEQRAIVGSQAPRATARSANNTAQRDFCTRLQGQPELRGWKYARLLIPSPGSEWCRARMEPKTCAVSDGFTITLHLAEAPSRDGEKTKQKTLACPTNPRGTENSRVWP